MTNKTNLGIEFPDLIKSWHPTKNGTLTPFDFMPKSGKTAWWLCPKGHEWEARIAGRSNGNGCPYCSGHKLCLDNSLGFNSPHLVEEWHPSKNGDLTPYGIMQKTDKKVWWLCKKGHEWESIVNSRVNGNGCPYCSGQKTGADNNFAFTHPELAKQWHKIKNANLLPTQVMPKSDKIIWWMCSLKHEWKAAIKKITSGHGCPYCSGHRVNDENSLSAINPDIASEWHPSKNHHISPNQVTAKSDKRVWWLCKNGHEWKAQVKNRSNGNNCPYCAGKLADENTNIEILYPELMKEWDFSKNIDLNPASIRPGSNKKAWWICKFGHEWQTTIISRTNGANCHFCFSQTSSLEIRVYCELKTIFDTVEWQKKIDNIECDVFIPTHLIGIELDGYPWHKDKEEKDNNKTKRLSNLGIKLLRVRDYRLNKLSSDDILYRREEEIFIILRILKKISELNISNHEKLKITNYINTSKLVNTTEYKKIIEYLPTPTKESSLLFLYPESQKKWNFNKNHPLTPDMFTMYSHKKVWWNCEFGHEWESRISSIAKGSGCPYCSKLYASSENNFAIYFPELLLEWNYDKNQEDPYSISPQSNKKTWWICENKHEWQTTVATRIKGTKCPHCKTLAFRFPNIAKEWHLSKNGDLTPWNIGGRSSRKVWWQCPKNHEWQAAINNRTAGSKCPHCRKQS